MSFAARLNRGLKYGIVTLTAALLYPQLNSRIEFHHSENEENRRRLLSCPTLLKGRFFPTFYLPYGFAQAIFGSLSKDSNPTVTFQTEWMVLPNGVKYKIDHASFGQSEEPASGKVGKKKAIVIILPGLSATSEEPYMNNITTECLKNDYEVVIFNNRWCSGALTLNVGKPACFYEDFKHFVDVMAKRYPDRQLFAIGHSYGANTLVNYLGEYPDHQKITAGVAVACPFDMLQTARWLENSWCEGYIVNAFKWILQTNKEELKAHGKDIGIDYSQLLSFTGGRDIDEHFTAKLLGFRSSVEYYKGISCVRRLQKVKTPLLFLSSKDDPIVHENCIAYEDCKQNPKVILAVTNTGGHVGWFEGVFRPRRWYPKPALEFVNAIYQEHSLVKA